MVGQVTPGIEIAHCPEGTDVIRSEDILRLAWRLRLSELLAEFRGMNADWFMVEVLTSSFTRVWNLYLISHGYRHIR